MDIGPTLGRAAAAAAAFVIRLDVLGVMGLPAAIWLAGCADTVCRRFTLAIRLTRRLRSRGSWLLFLQLSTARWIRPRLPRNETLSSASAQPTALHSVSYTRRLPLYWSLLQHARGYTQFSVLNSWLRLSTLTDSTSHRIVYSILMRSREYSNAIHCTPLPSCRTTNGVVAGIGPGAALELVPTPELWLCTADVGTGALVFVGG